MSYIDTVTISKNFNVAGRKFTIGEMVRIDLSEDGQFIVKKIGDNLWVEIQSNEFLEKVVKTYPLTQVK